MSRKPTALLIGQIYPADVLPHAFPNDLLDHCDLLHDLTTFSDHPNGESLVLESYALIGFKREIIHVECFEAREAIEETTPEREVELL